MAARGKEISQQLVAWRQRRRNPEPADQRGVYGGLLRVRRRCRGKSDDQPSYARQISHSITPSARASSAGETVMRIRISRMISHQGALANAAPRWVCTGDSRYGSWLRDNFLRSQGQQEPSGRLVGTAEVPHIPDRFAERRTLLPTDLDYDASTWNYRRRLPTSLRNRPT